MTFTFVEVKSGLASIQHWFPEDCIVSAIILDVVGKTSILPMVATIKQTLIMFIPGDNF